MVPRNTINPFRTAVPVLGTNQSNSKYVAPQNGTAVLNGLNMIEYVRTYFFDRLFPAFGS